MTLAQTLFGFKGRIARLPYFGYSLLAACVSGVSMLAGVYGFSTDSGGGAILGGLLLLAGVVGSVWAGLALNIKRLQDMGLSGVNAIWIVGLSVVGSVAGQASSMIEIVCGLASIGVGLWILFTPGQPQANEYGPPPGDQAAHAAARTIAA